MVPLAAGLARAHSALPLARLIEGAPGVETCVLVYSTAHKIGLGAVPLQEPNKTPKAGVGG